jgi:hypothetical protein
MEVWKSCFENYEISNLGNCRRKLKNNKYKSIDGSILNRGEGYKYFQVNRNGKRTNYLFHHLVAQQFIGDRPENLIIDHIDRNSLNNNVDNLRYTTQKNNMKNTDCYLTHIEEDDPKKRAIIRAKEYVDNNREYVLQKKKEYYLKNREKYLEYWKLKRLNVLIIEKVCEKCKCLYNIKECDLKNRKTELCKKCVSINNLNNIA